MSTDGPLEESANDNTPDRDTIGDVGDSPSDLGDAPSWYGETIEADASDAACIDRFRGAIDAVGDDAVLARASIGGYRPMELIGRGGMGAVYRAESVDGRTVALKVLRPDLLQQTEAQKRFKKEAQLLSQADSPAITRLYETGEDQGVTFLAMEFVDGVTLSELIRTHGKLSEPVALSIISQVVAGLATLHPIGIVHRDIKPSNIMIASDAITGDRNAPNFNIVDGSVKLTDFGLARHVQQPEHMELTKTHAIVGTPQYLAPEQFASGHDVDPTVDVYAIGATLFEMLAGKPALSADSFVEVIQKQRHWNPPLLCSLDDQISAAVSDVVAKTLEKQPLDRYADAAELQADLERLQRGQPSAILAHPVLPETNAPGLRSYELVCELKSSPENLWPYVSNTQRINRAVDLPAVDFSIKRGEHGELQQFGSVKFLGMNMQWREHPFEWIESRSMSVLRQLTSGPLQWVSSSVQLKPSASGGTTLTHRFVVRPRGIVGNLVASIQVGRRSVQAFKRVYQRIDDVIFDAVPDQNNRAIATGVQQDAFQPRVGISSQQRARLDKSIADLKLRAVDHDVLLHLMEFIEHAAPQAAGRMQPTELAKQWGVSRKKLIAVFLHATQYGILNHRWDIHCPICRVPSDSVPQLSDVKSHGRCEVCNKDFSNDMSHGVEMVFRVSDRIRKVDQETYCMGGPWHLPHVVAQRRLAVGERHTISLALCEGDYLIRSPQLSTSVSMKVAGKTTTPKATLELSPQLGRQTELRVAVDEQRVTLVNHFQQELIVRIERTAQQKDILSAAEIAAHPLFAELFPSEVIARDAPVMIQRLTFLVNRLVYCGNQVPQQDELNRYAAVQHYLDEFRSRVAASGRNCFKVLGDTAIAVFYDDDQARRAADTLSEITPAGYRNCVTTRQGPAVMANIDGRLEYFGETLAEVLNEGLKESSDCFRPN